MTMVGYQYGGMSTYTDNDVDRLYEAETARLIEAVFGGQDRRERNYEACKDVEVAIRKMKEARDWLGNAILKGATEEMEDQVTAYYERMDEMIASLSSDLEDW